jgi:hypothetical protein
MAENDADQPVDKLLAASLGDYCPNLPKIAKNGKNRPGDGTTSMALDHSQMLEFTVNWMPNCKAIRSAAVLYDGCLTVTLSYQQSYPLLL